MRLLYFEYRISNKEYRTAEVFESSKAIFFNSIFCGSLFCGSAAHIFDDLIADSLMQSADRRDLILRFQCSRLRLKGFGAASSIPRRRFASDGIFDRFQLLCFFFLTPDTRHLTPITLRFLLRSPHPLGGAPVWCLEFGLP